MGEAPREDADVETSSDAYALRFGGAVGAWFLDVQARAALDLLAPWPRARVIEFGGGHGQLALALLDAGHDVTVYASDPSCRARVERFEARGLRFAHGDLRHAPWPDRGFDVALAFRLLPHAHDVAGLVAELCRVARAAVIVDYPTLRSANAVSGLLFGAKRKVEGDTRPFRVFKDAEIAGALAAHGFAVTGRRGQFVIPMAAHRALGLAPVSQASEGVLGGLGLRDALGSPVVLRAERRG